MLSYSRVDAHCIRTIRPYFDHQSNRNCDYTVGVVYMWRNFFHTEYALQDNMLFLKMRDKCGNIFHLIPIGDGNLSSALNKLTPESNGLMRFSAVTEDQLPLLTQHFGPPLEIITERRWADYIYDRQSLSTFSGKKLAGQRNHVNRFLKDHHSFIYDPITPQNAAQAEAFLHDHMQIQGKEDPTAQAEYGYTIDTLRHLEALEYTGALLRLPNGTIVGLCLGETVGDTLYVHAEKALRDIHGASQLLCREYAAHADASVKYINREDDMGDEGLRYAKLSLHPSILLMKHTVIFRIK